ncbi:protein transporter SEC24 [Mycena amicta]|nr:protein transporter SEC24 [Mycena amicta]
MSSPPQIFGPKKRQYAADQTQAYSGATATVESLYQEMESLSIATQTQTQPSVHPEYVPVILQPQEHVDLMLYPPDPQHLLLPPPPILLPPGVAELVGPQDNAQMYQQPTLTAVPRSDTLLRQVKLPLGLIVSPHRTLEPAEELPPLVQDGIIARCGQCLAYINPYVRFLDYNTRWRCSLCSTTNFVPTEFGFSRVSGAGVDAVQDQYRSRAELTHTVVDFAATADYLRSPPQQPAFVFVLDVGEAAVTTGLFATAVRVISHSLDRLPNAQQRTRVALICYDSALHFFKISLDKFEMLVAPDISETYLPLLHADLLVNISEPGMRAGLESLLERLPELFNGGQGETRSATGSALDAARALLIVLIAASAPNFGRGALDSLAASSKVSSLFCLASSILHEKNEERTVAKSGASFYHDLAISCVKGCVSVDIFLAGRRYQVLATLSLLPHYTSGLTMHYPDFTVSSIDAMKFSVELGRALEMPSLLEAEMRVRCSRGISVKSMHGNFFLQGTDRAVFPAMPLNQGYAIELQIDAHLSEPFVVIQTGLLHTTSSGERAIRVITTALPVVGFPGEVFASADARALVSLFAKQAVQRTVVRSLEEQRDKLLYKVVHELCAAYAGVYVTPASELQLRVPSRLRMFPVLMLGLFKKIATQVQLHDEQGLDLRGYMRTYLTSASLDGLVRFIYPAVYALHTMPLEDDSPNMVLPPPLPLTSAWWEPHGLYLIDAGDGQNIYVWVGRMAVPQLVQDVFGMGVSSYEELTSGKKELPTLGTAISRTTNAIIAQGRNRPGALHYPSVVVVKDEPGPDGATRKLGADLIQTLVHDSLDDLRPSYRQFLVKVHEGLK